MADDAPSLIELTAGVVSAYLGNHKIAANDLPRLIETVYLALHVGGGAEPEASEKVALTRAQIRTSITPDALISFEDGRSYKALKRHLTLRDITPEAYRAKWGLPSDYPMTAPSYSERRSAMAKSFGLGRKIGRSAPDTGAQTPPAPAPPQASARAARKPRAPKAAAADVRRGTAT